MEYENLDLSEEEIAALKAMARREIAWGVVRSRVRNRVIAVAAFLTATLFLWDQIRAALLYFFKS